MAPLRSVAVAVQIRARLEHPLRTQPFAREYPLNCAVARDNCDQSEDERLAARAAQFALLDPRLKITSGDFDKLAEMHADKRIEVRTQLEGAVLQEPEDLGLFHQGLGDQFKGSRKRCLSIPGFSNAGQQIATQMQLPQPG